MSFKEIIFSLTLIIIITCTIISTGLIPLSRLITFKNKIAYIKDKHFENKFEMIIFIILFPLLVGLTIWMFFYSINQTGTYSSVKLIRMCISLYIICNAIARFPKQCIYKEGIKTNLYFVKWNEIEQIYEDKSDLKVCYRYKYVFFNIRHIYTIKDCPAEIKVLLYKFNSI